MTTANAFSQSKQFLYIEFTPTDAILELNGEIQETEDGTYQKLLPFGVHEYRIYKDGYYDVKNTIDINNVFQTYRLQHNLKERIATVTLSTASDASIYINGEYVGTGSWTGKLKIGEEYIFESKKEKHTTSIYKKTISQTDEHKTIAIPYPTPIYGSLAISCSPAKANLYIDEKFIGPTPQYIHQLIIGKYNISIEFDQYYSTGEKVRYTETVDIQDNVETEVYISAKQLYGTLSAASEPSNANVYFDNKFIGVTPGEFILPIGKHELEICFDKYFSTGEKVSHKETIDIQGNEKTYVSSKQIYGTLSIKSEQPCASIYVDNKFLGTAPGDYILPVGNHEIKLDFDSYYYTGEKVTYKDTVLLNAHGNTELYVPRSYGTVSFKNVPYDHDIYIDSIYCTNSSGEYIVALGKHQVTLYKDSNCLICDTFEIDTNELQNAVFDFNQFNTPGLEGNQLDKIIDISDNDINQEEEPIPFHLVEEKPSFNGGDVGLFSKWVSQRLIYPDSMKMTGVQGRVTLQFTIETDGSITNVNVIGSLNPSFDNEAVRVVSSSPKWKPGKQDGKDVRVLCTFPVKFQ